MGGITLWSVAILMGASCWLEKLVRPPATCTRQEKSE